MIPAIAYASRSKDEEDGKSSTDDQLAAIREAVEHDDEREIVGEFSDHASGYSGNRGPDLERAIRQAVALAPSELWAFISSRFGRGTGKLGEARAIGKLFYDLRAVGVTLRTVKDDDYVTNEMLIGFASSQASKYSEDLKEHVRRGLNANADRGIPHGRPSFGYMWCPPSGDDIARGKRIGDHWVECPHEKRIMDRIYRMWLVDGLNYQQIAKRLNAELVPTRGGGPWSATVIRKVLTSRHLLGEFRAVDHVPGCVTKRCGCPVTWRRGKHPPIIDHDTWVSAQVRVAAVRASAPNGRAGRVPNAHIFVRGALRCGLCGAAMKPRTIRSTGQETYVCTTRKETGGKFACAMPTMERAAVEQAALSLFEAVALDVEATRDRLAAQMTASVDETRVQAERAAREVNILGAEAARVDRDYRRGEVSASNYERLASDIARDLDAAVESQRLVTERAENLDATAGSIDAKAEVLRRLTDLRVSVAGRINRATDDIDALRAAWTTVFDHTVLMPRDVDNPSKDAFDVMPSLRPEMVVGGWDENDGFVAPQDEPAVRVPIHLDSNNSTASWVAK